AGFAVGVVEKNEIIDGKKITAGDAVIGVASSGFHSNGYSLIRKILKEEKLDLQAKVSETGKSLQETLMTPTKLYTPLIQVLKQNFHINGIAHITGGGLEQNPPRILPQGRMIEWKKNSWPVPSFMKLFQEKGKISDRDFQTVFNAGIGMIFVVPAAEMTACITAIEKAGEKAWHIGAVR
ncbi:MAG: AIR synthase-related protein, partial [Deltaproteobacteria bacterium]|nr:AIR synthase-related protein [Deltaproteobacteria bacterium]